MPQPKVLPETLPAGTLWENNMWANCGSAVSTLTLRGDRYFGEIYDEVSGRLIPSVAAALIQWESVP